MADFCVVNDIENVLQIEITDPAQLASAEMAIDLVTEAIRNRTGQQIELVEDDEITLDVAPGTRTRVFLPQIPVIEVSAVVEDGVTLIAGTDYALGQHGILHRLNGYWKSGVQVLAVTYSHGYATLPDDVVGVAARAASRLFQAGLKAAASEGVPGIQATSLGDYSVTYQQEGAAEGLLGASGARVLLMSEMDILDKYGA